MTWIATKEKRAALVGKGLFLVGLASVCAPGLRLVWNATPSLPRGLYVVTAGEPQVGELVWFEANASGMRLARTRQYLPPEGKLLKHVVAKEGSLWCATSSFVVDGTELGPIARRDTQNRPLPQLNHCGRVPLGHVLLAARHPRSFDSRYFGPVPFSAIAGIARPLWILSP